MRSATGFEPSDKWFGQQAVYRISMGNFMFFGAMSLALLGVKYKGDKRGQILQHGSWFIKFAVWILFNALPFLFPNGLVQAYGESHPLFSALPYGWLHCPVRVHTGLLLSTGTAGHRSTAAQQVGA